MPDSFHSSLFPLGLDSETTSFLLTNFAFMDSRDFDELIVIQN
jgi:hypothetical protein